MNLRNLISSNTPTIFVVSGLAAFGVALVLVAKAAPKARDILDEQDVEADTWQKVKAVAPIYAPSIGVAMLGAGCILAGNHINATRYAGLMAAYTVADQALVKWQNSTLETIGKKKYEEIRRDTVKPPTDFDPDEEVLTVVNNGTVLFWDNFTQKPFMHESIDQLKRAVNRFNVGVTKDDWGSLNDLYFELGLEPIPVGDDFGWSVQDRDILELKFDAFVIENKSRAPIVMSFDPPPRLKDLIY